MPLLEISILLHKESDSEMAEKRKRKNEELNIKIQTKKQRLNNETSTNTHNWVSHQHASQYEQYVAQKIAKTVRTTFNGKLKFDDDFLERSSWKYEGTIGGGKQFENDLFFKVGRNGYKDNELLELPKDLFYSINRSNYVTIEDNELSLQDPNSESHFVIFEITTDSKKIQTKLAQLNKNIESLIETKVIGKDLKDIFIAGIATKNRSKDLSVKNLKELPHLLTLHQSGKLFFVEQPQGPFEMLPELIAKIDQFETSFENLSSRVDYLSTELGNLSTKVDYLSTEFHSELGNLSTRVDNLSTEFHSELGNLSTRVDNLSTEVRTELGNLSTRVDNLSTEVRTDLVNITNLINQKYTPKLSKKQLKLKGLKKINLKTRKFNKQ